MRQLFTAAQAADRGLTRSALRWGERTGRWRRLDRLVYAEGPEEPTPLDRARAAVLAADGVACGRLAGCLLSLDGVHLRGPELIVPPSASGRRTGVRRRAVSEDRIIVAGGVRCTNGLQTMLDLGSLLDDIRWEQALESALRKHLVSLAALEAEARGRAARVLTLRPEGVAPTESLLETLMVQLIRTVPEIPPPVRQLVIHDEHGVFVARLDLSWPELGLFIELDGEHHLGQPVYDANRETAVVAATGWLCGRFTWTEVVRFPKTTARRLAALVIQARRRPLR